MAQVDLEYVERDLMASLLQDHVDGIDRGDISYGTASHTNEMRDISQSALDKLNALAEVCD